MTFTISLHHFSKESLEIPSPRLKAQRGKAEQNNMRLRNIRACVKSMKSLIENFVFLENNRNVFLSSLGKKEQWQQRVSTFATMTIVQKIVPGWTGLNRHLKKLFILSLFQNNTVKLDFEYFVHLFEEYYLSDDPSDLGNFINGRLRFEDDVAPADGGADEDVDPGLLDHRSGN